MFRIEDGGAGPEIDSVYVHRFTIANIQRDQDLFGELRNRRNCLGADANPWGEIANVVGIQRDGEEMKVFVAGRILRIDDSFGIESPSVARDAAALFSGGRARIVFS